MLWPKDFQAFSVKNSLPDNISHPNYKDQIKEIASPIMQLITADDMVVISTVHLMCT